MCSSLLRIEETLRVVWILALSPALFGDFPDLQGALAGAIESLHKRIAGGPPGVSTEVGRRCL